MSSLNAALKQIENEVREGLKHGFFDFTVGAEKINQGKRRLVLKAGKSYQYLITEDELKN